MKEQNSRAIKRVVMFQVEQLTKRNKNTTVNQ